MFQHLKNIGDGDTYHAYIETQRGKLKALPKKVAIIDIGRQKQVVTEFNELLTKGLLGVTSFHGTSIICLGARLGGEVRAFKSMGALAVGIDLNPGESSLDVLSGDFHDIAFPDESFDFGYSNVLDHIFDQDKFASEMARILKPGGIFFASVYPDSFDAWTGPDAVSLRNKDTFIAKFKLLGFDEVDIHKTSYQLMIGNRPWNQKIETYSLRKLKKIF